MPGGAEALGPGERGHLVGARADDQDRGVDHAAEHPAIGEPQHRRAVQDLRAQAVLAVLVDADDVARPDPGQRGRRGVAGNASLDGGSGTRPRSTRTRA